MTIVQLDKMTLYGAESQKSAVIDKLQELGCVHLVDLVAPAEDFAQNDDAGDTREALNLLRAFPERWRQVRRKDDFDRRQVVADVLRLRRETESLNDKREQLQQAIGDLEPWGEFRLPEEGRVGNVRLWFYVVPLRDVAKVNATRLVWREVRRDHQNAYVLVLNTDEPKDMPGALRELDRGPLSSLQTRLEIVQEQLEEIHHETIGQTRWCDLLSDVLDEADDAAAHELAMRQTVNGTSVYAMQGWIPRNAADHIRHFAKEHLLAVTIEPAGPDDEPPTLLDNPERFAGSESLVTFYKTPDYRAWDPSLVAYASFAIFFAMIMSDAGYGIILALLTAYLWKKMGLTRGGRRGRVVLATVVGATIVYGVLCGSYFGVSPEDNSILGRLKLIDATSQSLMMPLTIVIGVIHLSLANVVMAWSKRGQATALASLGWVVVMTGATAAGIGALADVTESIATGLSQLGSALLIGGLLAVFLFSSRRPLFPFSIKNHVLRIFDGLSGLTGISGLFGDVLSYLRLFALGLSSARLSATFNELGASAWDEAGFGVIGAIIIVFLGHSLNLMLGIMSGVVHGLRLNCIEFFKWSLPEEGHLFKAFAKKARQP